MRYIKRSLSDIPENEQKRSGMGLGWSLFYHDQHVPEYSDIHYPLYQGNGVERDLIALVEAYEKHPLVQKAQKDMQKLLDRKKTGGTIKEENKADIKTKEVDRTLKVREHAKQLPKELIKDITLKSAERSLLSTHDGSHFSPKQSPEQYASDRLEEGIKWSASKGETIVSQGSKKAAKKMAEKTERVIKRTKE